MTTAEIRDALAPAGLDLPDETCGRLAAYCELLLEGNREMNLIGPATESDMATRHILDSLAPLRAGLRAPRRLIDVGSGAGLPGIPLAIALPDTEVVLLDSLGKRCAFLRRTAEALSLSNVTVVEARAEEAAHTPLRESFDAVTARAVTKMSALAELCLPFLRTGGVFCAYKTARAEEETAAAARVVRILGGEPMPPFDYELSGAAMRLVLLGKKSPTPIKYPRPWGSIKKSEL